MKSTLETSLNTVVDRYHMLFLRSKSHVKVIFLNQIIYVIK